MLFDMPLPGAFAAPVQLAVGVLGVVAARRNEWTRCYGWGLLLCCGIRLLAAGSGVAAGSEVLADLRLTLTGLLIVAAGRRRAASRGHR
ncbi:MAG: hypothetical protein HOV94_30005 [Saccharothrix sp.]|nr:hypothetical protein [Saccharothrix sp.]